MVSAVGRGLLRLLLGLGLSLRGVQAVRDVARGPGGQAKSAYLIPEGRLRLRLDLLTQPLARGGLASEDVVRCPSRCR